LNRPSPLNHFKGLQGADDMKKFYMEVMKLLNSQTFTAEVEPELIIGKYKYLHNIFLNYTTVTGAALSNNRKELFWDEIDRRRAELDQSLNDVKNRLKDLSIASLKENDGLLSGDDLVYIETIKLFLTPGYEPPIDDEEEIYVHFLSLMKAYKAVLDHGTIVFNVLQQLDLAAFKILNNAASKIEYFYENSSAYKKDAKILRSRKISKSKKRRPERQAFNDALLQLVTENNLFVELPPIRQLTKIRMRMIKNGFSANDLVIMHQDKKSGQSGKWLKEELSHLTTK
jgi:hypothetical protein